MNLNNYVNIDKGVVSLESISLQMGKGLEVVDELSERFEVIKSIITKENFNSSLQAFRDKRVETEFNKINAILKDRFGINFKHVNSEGNYCVITVPPIKDGVLNPDFGQTLENVDEIINTSSNNPEVLRKPVDLNVDVVKIADDIKKSYNSIKKSISKSGLVFDTKNARINGLEDSYILYLGIDSLAIFKDFDLTPREATAVLLHEVGHAFTHILYSYRSTTETITLAENFTSYIKKDTLEENIVEMYYKSNSKDGNKELNIANSGDRAKMVVSLAEDWLFNIQSLDPNNPEKSGSSEQLADLFSIRFGLNKELVSSLEKVDIDVNRQNIYGIVSSSMVVGFILFMQTLNVMAALTGLFIIPLVTLFVSAIMSLIFGGEKSQETTYDSFRTRLNRIRIDSIRQIKRTDLDSRAKNAIINDILEMDKIIDRAVDENNFSSLISIMLLPWNRTSARRRILNEKLEELMENRLYVSSAKLRR